MKPFKTLTIVALLAAVFTLSRCDKDSDNCSSCPPSEPGTPYPFTVPQGFPQPFIPADNPITMEGVKLGRFLFYDKQLSADHSLSCGSCHGQQNAFGDTHDKVMSDGINQQQTERHTMVIFNLAFQNKFFWDGRVSSLEEQSLHPIQNPKEMGNSLDTVVARLKADPMYPPLFEEAFGDPNINRDRIAKAIAQFERTIISANSEFDRVKRLGGLSNPFEEDAGSNASKNNGYRLFISNDGGDCFHCHGDKETQFLLGAFGVDNFFLNNGLDSAISDDGRALVTNNPDDRGRFKVPSLRNVEFSFPYMHDGSIPDLDSLVEFYNFGGFHQNSGSNADAKMEFQGIGLKLSQQEKDDLKAFLKTLTDYEFLENPAYSDPFQN